MKTILRMLCILAVALSAAFSTTSAQAAPEMQFPTQDIDLGAIPIGQPVEFRIEFMNAGTYPLIIHHMRSEQHNVQLQQVRDAVHPNQWWDIYGNVRAMRPGYDRVQIMIFSNDPRHQQIVNVHYVGQ